MEKNFPESTGGLSRRSQRHATFSVRLIYKWNRLSAAVVPMIELIEVDLAAESIPVNP
jgi:hypothetical protein